MLTEAKLKENLVSLGIDPVAPDAQNFVRHMLNAAGVNPDEPHSNDVLASHLDHALACAKKLKLTDKLFDLYYLLYGESL